MGLGPFGKGVLRRDSLWLSLGFGRIFRKRDGVEALGSATSAGTL